MPAVTDKKSQMNVAKAANADTKSQNLPGDILYDLQKAFEHYEDKETHLITIQ